MLIFSAIFGAFFILLLIMAEVIPISMTSLPYLERYLLGNMVLVVLAMFISAVVSYMHDYSDPGFTSCLQKVSRSVNFKNTKGK